MNDPRKFEAELWRTMHGAGCAIGVILSMVGFVVGFLGWTLMGELWPDSGVPIGLRVMLWSVAAFMLVWIVGGLTEPE